MKKKEKKMIMALIVLIIIVIITAIMLKNRNQSKVVEGNNNNNNSSNSEQAKEEFVDVLEDGTRLNTSGKLHETKSIDGMEITNFQLTEKDNVTLLLGTVTNTSNTTKGGYPVDLKIMDKQGNEIITIGAFIGTVNPGESTQFNTSATFNYANAYDFSVTKK